MHPTTWDDIPASVLLSQELLNVAIKAVSEISPGQQAGMTLCDIEGFSAEEACNILEISETNQRVLLHRARAKVRSVLENYLNPEK